MIPIRGTIPSEKYPFVNNTIIGINLVIYLLEVSQGPQMNRFIYIYGLVPARYTISQVASYFTIEQQIFSIISFMFLHGGFFHLLSNLWTLYIFGNNVEDSMGHVSYLVFYLLCGAFSGLAHLIFNLHSNVPVIGASGAIAGVMGAYLILHPRSRILTLIPIIIIPWFMEIPAFFFLGIWFFIQLLNAAAGHGASGIAWWAHVGGFIFGAAVLSLFRTEPHGKIVDKKPGPIIKKKTYHLQVIRPIGFNNDSTLYGTITISPFEADAGCVKLVNIAWGFHKKLIKVTIPAGIKQKGIVRLKGLGKLAQSGGTGDLLLEVNILP